MSYDHSCTPRSHLFVVTTGVLRQTSREAARVPAKGPSSLASEVYHEHSRILRIQVSLQVVLPHQVFDSWLDVRYVVLRVNAFAYDDTNRLVSTLLARRNLLLGTADGFGGIEAVQVDLVWSRVFVVGLRRGDVR